MRITIVTPHQRPNSGGTYAIEQFAAHAAASTEVHLVVAKGEPVPIEGVHLHGPDVLAGLELPDSDALLIHADMRGAERLLGLSRRAGLPMLLFQGYGSPHDPVVHANLTLASHAICTSSWLVREAVAAECTARLVRYGLDRALFSPGPPTDERGPVVAMMTHPLDWKGTADGVSALRLARREIPEIEVCLFGKLDTGLEDATYLPTPNQRSDVAALLRRAAVFVCSSWEEGFGMPGLEAIAAGAALATTDTRGSRDYAFHRRTALVSEPHDPPALARGILDLIRDAELRRRLIDEGQRHIGALYPDWERATGAFLDAIEDVRKVDATARRDAGVEPAARRSARPEVELGRARAALEVELEEARAELHRAYLERRQTTRELRRHASELELASAERHRLRAALARTRIDAQLAEAERDAFKARASELGALLDGLDGERRVAADRAAGEHVSFESLPRATRRWPPLPEEERPTREAFAATYRELVDGAPPCSDGADPLALPIPADLRGALVGIDDERQAGEPTVDVVVCVHDALEDTRRCLWSLLHKATRRFRLIVVDDGSDPPTTELLQALAASHPALTLISNADPPHGYPIAANLGLRASRGDYVVLLNSDTIVTRGWLERIVGHGERHARAGLLGPLSNAATHQSIPERRAGGEWAVNPLPCWLTEDGMALMLDRAAPRTDTRLPFLNGFCYVIKRAVIEAIGYFDEQTFPEGYAEENDYSQRAREAGFEPAVVDDAYVYHAKSRSYGTSAKPISRRAYRAFLDKHGRERIEALVGELEASTGLDPVRTAIAEGISSPEATESALARRGEPELSIAFVLPGMADGGSGGSHSIYQEVRGLRRLGVPARIMLAEQAWKRAGAAYDDAADLFERYSDVDDLARRTEDANVIVATHFKSVAALAAIHRERDDFLPAYYVQDYEALFQFADAADNEEAAASYTAIPGMLLFAKTHWLCNVVGRSHDVFVAKVEPSIDETLFCGGERRPGRGPVRVAAMVRPRTARRQPHSTVAVLERLLDELPGEVEVVTFGCREEALAAIAPSPAIRSAHLGVLKREQVADLMRRCDVFLDMSTYQAFGRTALEAMACGCAAVVPRLGGVWEYAEDGANALAVDTLDRGAALGALASLVEDRGRLARLQSAARATASRYSILRAALSEYVVLHHAYSALRADRRGRGGKRREPPTRLSIGDALAGPMR